MTVFKRLSALIFIFALTLSLVYLPFTAKAAGEKVVITLDAGHGGPSDPGACHGSTAEKTLTLEMAYKIKSYLEANGNFTVYLSRTGDYALTKAQRLKIANDYNSDFLLSIHFDGNNNPSVNGVTVYTSVLPEFSPNALASSIAANLSTVGFKNNGVKQNADPECFWNSNKQWDVYDPSVGINADYYGIISWGCKFGFPAIIVEHGYLSNAGDANLILSDGTLDRMAKAEADALISYFAGHTHIYGATVVDYPSNCAIQGKSSAHCTVCRHRSGVKTLPADPDNHYYYSDAIVSHKVSCDTEESVSYKCRISENFIEKGLECEEHFLTDVLKPKTEHNYVVTYHIDVAHAVDGITRYSCTNCASNYTETVAAEGHTWVMKHTAPATCDKNGAVTYVCPSCQEEYTENIPAFGHAYVRLELIKEANCTEAGSEKVKCSSCGFETQRDIAALGHTRTVLEHVDSTCSVQGFDRCICYRCNTEYTENIQMPEHDFELTEKTELSCTTDGKTVYTCKLCGEQKILTDGIASHSFDLTDQTDATCETAGASVYTCSVCGETKTETTPSLGHYWNDPAVIKKPSAFTKGIIRTECILDGAHSYENVIPAAFESDAQFRTVVITSGIFIICAAAISLLMKFGIIPYGFDFKKESAKEENDKTDKTDKADETNETDKQEEKEPELIEK